VARCEAICVLTSSETCATDTPSSAGDICLSTRRTPGWCQASTMPCQRKRMCGISPRALSAGTWMPACSTPPSITPMVSV